MNLKNYIGAALLLCGACTPSENYKEVRNQVVTIHDKVMADGELLIINRQKLDSLNNNTLKAGYPGADSNKAKKDIMDVLKILKHDETLMDQWMEAFEAEITGKTNQQAVAYFKNEKKKILFIDSIYKTDTKRSAALLLKLMKK